MDNPKTLSKDFIFVRVDLYNVDESILFSELTFTPHGRYFNFTPSEWNLKLGSLLELNKTFKRILMAA